MNRRRFLRTVGPGVTIALAGCISGRPQTPDDGGEDPATPEGTPMSVSDREAQPDVPVEYSVEMVKARATDDHPARVGVGITNVSDSAVAMGEERTVQFHHVSSTNSGLYLHPAGEETWTGPVEPGCWRLTEPVAVPEYYGTIEIEPGETRRAESLVYGHPDLPEGECLPPGDHRVAIEGVVGEDTDAVLNEEELSEFSWAFTLQVGETS